MLNYTYDNPIGLILIAFLLGCFVSFICYQTSQCTRNMTISLAVLPALVCVSLVAVNGDSGASIAVLGIFGLVRFRSVAGSSRDIINVFFAMASGLMVATNRIVLAIVGTGIIGLLLWLSTKLLSEKQGDEYQLKILVPEDMNFSDKFETMLHPYFADMRLTSVRTTNMGSLFELNFLVRPRANMNTKAMLDEIRTHNGNLNIVYCRTQSSYDVL